MSSGQLFVFPGYGVTGIGVRGSSALHVCGVAVSSGPRRFRQRFLTRVLARLIDATPEQLETDLFRERTAPFFLAPSRSENLVFEVNGHTVPESVRTRRDGSFRATFPGPIPQESSPARCRVSVASAAGHLTPGTTELHLLEPEGISVVSDIDDTIKFSHVENRAELLANTFLREYLPIEGMSQVYADLQRRGMAFHYITASPWQLHQPLIGFLQKCGYPEGSMHYRFFRLSVHLLKRLGLTNRTGKSIALLRLLADCPSRRFILIGDSGERDPDIYGKAWREYPHAIARILIRLIAPEHRYKESVIRARMHLPSNVFDTFCNSEQLGNLLASF